MAQLEMVYPLGNGDFIHSRKPPPLAASGPQGWELYRRQPAPVKFQDLKAQKIWCCVVLDLATFVAIEMIEMIEMWKMDGKPCSD